MSKPPPHCPTLSSSTSVSGANMRRSMRTLSGGQQLAIVITRTQTQIPKLPRLKCILGLLRCTECYAQKGSSLIEAVIGSPLSGSAGVRHACMIEACGV